MRHTLMLLALVCFFSCKKTEQLKEEKQPEPTLVDDSYQELREHAIVTNTLSKDFFSLLLAESLSHPEIFGLQNEGIADTRECPTVTSSGSTFPLTLVLDFGAAPGCTPQFFTLPKIGQITTTLFRPCFTEGEGEDFTIGLSEDYQEQGYNIIGGSGNGVVFKFKYIPTETSYKIAFDEDIVFENITSGNQIIVGARPDFLNPFGEIGFIPDSGRTEDDPSDPLTYIDNVFYMNILNSHITCTNGSNSQEFCLDITSESGNGLEFQPWECHCITKGVLRINEDSDCTMSNSNSNADLIYDFGDGACDGDVEVTEDGMTDTVNLLLCD